MNIANYVKVPAYLMKNRSCECVCGGSIVNTDTKTINYYYQDCWGVSYTGTILSGATLTFACGPELVNVYIQNNSISITGSAIVTYGTCESPVPTNTPTPSVTPTQTPTITPTPTPTPPFTCASCRTYDYTATSEGAFFNYYSCDTGNLESVGPLGNNESGIACNCDSVGSPFFSPGTGTFSDTGPC